MTCKKIIVTWGSLAFGISLFIFGINFLVNLYNFLSDKNFDVVDLIQVCFYCAVWTLILITCTLFFKGMIIEIFSDIFEQMEDMFTEYDDSFDEDDYEFR